MRARPPTRLTTAVAAVALLLTAVPSARADDPDVPSAGEVAGARQAAAEAARQETALTARQDEVAARLAALQVEVARATDAETAAQQDLEHATAVADKAADDLTAARAAASEAHHAAAATAAQLWTRSGDLDELELLLAGSPEAMSDAQVVLDGASARTSAAVTTAAGSAAAADARSAYLAAARRDEQDAAARATRAREGVESTAASARDRAAALAAEEADLAARLADLREHAATLATQRQEGLAAQARARARAKAKAEAEAAARAARQRAAEQSAATPVIGGSGGGGGSGTSPSAARATARSMVGAHGWGSGQFACLVDLWNGESGWSWSATNPSSGAYGIPQSLPGYKMASAGGDWLTNPTTQIRWGLGYIDRAYGSPCAAWDAWLRRSPHWY